MSNDKKTTQNSISHASPFETSPNHLKSYSLRVFEQY